MRPIRLPMLYRLVRPVARYVLRYYFRNIDLTGLEHIPDDAAVILAANHPTAFIEPCLLACFQPRVLHFLARGDLYKNAFFTQLLRGLNILPVYRLKDGGYAKLTRNYETFEECYRVLSRRKAIMILAEGRCIHEKRLRPLRKGTARVALGALDRDASLPEVYVVPVGVNFVAAERVRTRVMIRCGPPLKASKFLAAYRHNEAQGMRTFTAELRSRLEGLVVRLPSLETDRRNEELLDVVRAEIRPTPVGITNTGSQLDAELAVAAAMQSGRLDDLPPRPVGPAHQPDSPRPAIGLLPVAAFLLLFHLPLWWLADYIGARFPKTIEFRSPVRFAAVGVGTLLYLPLLVLLPWPGKLYLLTSLVTVNWSLRRIEAYQDWRAVRRFAQMVAGRRELLLVWRTEVLETLAPYFKKLS